MKHPIKVSIVIPVYNGANYMRRAIDSALGQTYRDVEVLVVNDGSTDNGETEAIAVSYGDRIRYFCKDNGGVSSALNLGIQNMTGQWFVWLSHDDFVAADRIEEDVRLIALWPNAKVIFGRQVFVDTDGGMERCAYFPLQTSFRAGTDHWWVHACTMTIHRSCFEECGGFNEGNRTTQDCEMIFRLGLRHPFFLSPNGITYTREHAERGTHKFSEQHRTDLKRLADFIHEHLPLEYFFPAQRSTDCDASSAWAYMANLYEYLGASKHAQECRWQIILLHRNRRTRVICMIEYGATVTGSTGVRMFCVALRYGYRGARRIYHALFTR